MDIETGIKRGGLLGRTVPDQGHCGVRTGSASGAGRVGTCGSCKQ